MSSTEGSVSNASQSWVSLRMPSQPPSYCDITRDCSLDQPLTPLLDDFDGESSPIFMNVPAFPFPPSPPAYSEVSCVLSLLHAAETVLLIIDVFFRLRRSSTATLECCQFAEVQPRFYSRGPEAPNRTRVCWGSLPLVVPTRLWMKRPSYTFPTKLCFQKVTARSVTSLLGWSSVAGSLRPAGTLLGLLSFQSGSTRGTILFIEDQSAGVAVKSEITCL